MYQFSALGQGLIELEVNTPHHWSAGFLRVHTVKSTPHKMISLQEDGQSLRAYPTVNRWLIYILGLL
jgi:hypothetical protein